MRSSVIAILLAVSVSACAGEGVGTTTRPSDPTSTSDGGVTTTLPPETTTSTTVESRALEGRRFVLDPGHNGMNWAYPDEIGELVDIGTGTKACNTTGTSGGDGYQEADFTWSVALLAKERLERLGATVTLTRDDNDGWGPCITERADIGNVWGGDGVISIHADGGPADGRGFHVIHPDSVAGYTDDIFDKSFDLALALREAYLATGMPVADYVGVDGLDARDDLGGLTLSDVPVVFLEAGNMRNTDDLELLADPEFQVVVAEALVSALLAFVTGH